MGFANPSLVHCGNLIVEQSFVAWAKMRARKLPQVKLGIGDDAAVLAACGEDSVVTSDSLMDGVHFDTRTTALDRIGRKLVSVNLSDLAAMAAEPRAVFLSMCVPQNQDRAADVIASEIYEGVCQAAEEYDIALAGGDTNCWDGPLVLHLTAVGKTHQGIAWQRSGAQPDDLIVVTGPLGGSLRGKHLDFQPRLDVAQKLRGQVNVHAAMDISDGLSVDLLRMCDASRCGAILHLDEVPISEAAEASACEGGKSAIEHALGDGEDFELLLAVAPGDYATVVQQVGVDSALRCGTFTSRTGLWSRDAGRLQQLATTGYVHGR